MIKSEKSIIYALIAVFVVLSIVFCDFSVSYAKESEELEIDYNWYQAGEKCGAELITTYNYDCWKSAELKKVLFPALAEKYEKDNIVHLSWWGSGEIYTGTFSSSSEIVSYVQCGIAESDLDSDGYFLGGKGYADAIKNNPDAFKKQFTCGAVSKSQMCYSFNCGRKNSNSVFDFYLVRDCVYSNSAKYNGNDYQFIQLMNPYSDNYDFGFYSSMKLFDSYKHAIQYLENGDLDGLVSDESAPKQTYSSELLLNDFDIQFHDSNKFEECYLDVKYTIPDSLKSVSSFQIDMDEAFDWIASVSGGLSDVTDSHTGTNYIDVLNHADGFRIYLKDIKAVDNFINQWDGAFDKALKRFVLGNLNYVNFPFSKYVIGSVKTSNLNIKFHLVADKKYGHYIDYNLNLLSGVGVKNSYAPDVEGNYTSNDDSEVMGHYYTDVGTDAAGNTTYNYYYYYSDGGKEKVSSEDAMNNTVTSTIEDGAIRINNSPVFNNNITVEGDNIRNEANSYADSMSDSTTNKSFIDKFLGFFDIIENNTFLGVFAKVFGWLPVGVSSLITTALGIIVGVRVFKFFK